ncbi:unnamed protein product, partial [Heterosigma akashiwo]
FFGVRWLILSPFRTRIMIGKNAEWTVGEVLSFIVLFVLSIFGVLSTLGKNSKMGHNAAVPLVIGLLLSQKNSLFALFLGVSWERAVWWHQACGWAALLMAAAHGLDVTYGAESAEDSSDDGGTMGAISTGIGFIAILATTCILSLPPMRRQFWELFVRTHWLLHIGVLVAGVLHKCTILLFPTALWVVDLLVRKIYMARMQNPREGLLTALPGGDLVTVTFPRAGLAYRAGQHLLLCVPAASPWEWHPLSIASAPHQEMVTLSLRATGDWGARVRALAGPPAGAHTPVAGSHRGLAAGRGTAILVEGPYGAPSVDIDDTEYRHFILICGGIGVSPMQSICNHLLYQHDKKQREIEKIWFVWSARDAKLLAEGTVGKTRGPPSDCLSSNGLPHVFSPNLLA